MGAKRKAGDQERADRESTWPERQGSVGVRSREGKPEKFGVGGWVRRAQRSPDGLCNRYLQREPGG